MQLPPPKTVTCENGHWTHIPTEDEDWFRCGYDDCEPVEWKRTAEDQRGRGA
jgi:hypothetical protein